MDPTLRRLAAATAATEDDVTRLAARVRPPRRWPRWLATAPLVLVAGWALTPPATLPEAPLSTDTLTQAGLPGTATGIGTLTRTQAHRWERATVDIRWEVGTLTTQVTTSGPALRVHTREATVSVDDGPVTVLRDRLGTRVTGGHTTCIGGAEGATCLPETAAAWLARADELRLRGADAPTIDASLVAGLAVASPEAPAYAELLAARIDLLLAQGDPAAARRLAADYPPSGPRAREISALLAAP